MATLPTWLNVSPQMFLQAAQAGGSQGLQVAQMRQQAAQQEAARQAAQQEMAQRLQMSREAQLMEQAARQQAASQEGRALDIRERLGFGDQAIRREELEGSRTDRREASRLRAAELERGLASDEIAKKLAMQRLMATEEELAAEKAFPAARLGGMDAVQALLNNPAAGRSRAVQEMIRAEMGGLGSAGPSGGLFRNPVAPSLAPTNASASGPIILNYNPSR